MYPGFSRNIFKPSHLSYLSTYEYGTDRVFQNVSIYNSDAGELPRRKHTTFRTWQKFEIKNVFFFNFHVF
jgi:hypothetical protein